MKYKVVPGVIMTSICEHYFLVSSKETIEINDTAAFCWERLQHESTPEELVLAIREYYEISDIDMVTNDITTLLSSLEGKRFIKRCRT